MSYPTGSARSDASGGPQGTGGEFRRRGRLFGFRYDVGVGITDLSHLGTGGPGSPPLQELRRLAPPGTPESTDAPAVEALGRWEWEGGR